jgi:hypothetical protein
MPPLTELAAADLTPDRAAELARVIELHARWEGRLADTPVAASVTGLRSRQRAYEVYRTRRAEYEARYGAVPEAAANTPDRLAGWCRVVAAVVRQAGGVDCPAVVETACRLAGRVAARLKADPVVPEPGDDAARVLDAVARWCDGLTVIPGGRGWAPPVGTPEAA